MKTIEEIRKVVAGIQYPISFRVFVDILDHLEHLHTQNQKRDELLAAIVRSMTFETGADYALRVEKCKSLLSELATPPDDGWEYIKTENASMLREAGYDYETKDFQGAWFKSCIMPDAALDKHAHYRRRKVKDKPPVNTVGKLLSEEIEQHKLTAKMFYEVTEQKEKLEKENAECRAWIAQVIKTLGITPGSEYGKRANAILRGDKERSGV